MNEKEKGEKIDLSVVIPVYNEEDVLEELFSRLSRVLDSITANYEVIFVADGCVDRSYEMLDAFYQKDRRYKHIFLSRKHSQEIAIVAGLDFAEGEAVVIIDADLQDPPELIADLWTKWKKGAEVVYAKREKREKRFLLKSLGAKFFYRLINKLSPMKIPEDTGNFRLLDRKAVLTFRNIRETSRYMRGLSVWIGFKQDVVYFKREDRQGGKTHNSFSSMFKVAFDAITSFSVVPLELATYLGFLSAFIGFVIALYVMIRRLFFPANVITGITLAIIAIFFIGGVQLIILGIIGEYIGRIYTEVQDRPLYIIDKKKGFK